MEASRVAVRVVVARAVVRAEAARAVVSVWGWGEDGWGRGWRR